jgi:hypothetical protein
MLGWEAYIGTSVKGATRSGDVDECGSSVVACRRTQSADLSRSTNLALRR